MTKKDLVNGMFGKESDGELFVIVGDRIIYEGGFYEDIDDLTPTLEWDDGASIDYLYECKCFADIHDGSAKQIWQRGEQKSEKPAENTITITKEDFLKVAEKVNNDWLKIAEDATDGGIASMIMSLQNVTFAASLAEELFG